MAISRPCRPHFNLWHTSVPGWVSCHNMDCRHVDSGRSFASLLRNKEAMACEGEAMFQNVGVDEQNNHVSECWGRGMKMWNVTIKLLVRRGIPIYLYRFLKRYSVYQTYWGQKFWNEEHVPFSNTFWGNYYEQGHYISLYFIHGQIKYGI